jgi:catechol 2,3-dioxygenase-like lactoylglutathione lyase family enzyme
MDQIAPLEVGIAVADLDRMLAFYAGVLSCTEVRRADIPASLTAALTSSRDGYVNVWLQAPGGEVVKLFRPPAAPARDAARPFLADRTGLAFLTFYCRDIETVLATAEEHGAVLRSDRALLGGAVGVKLAFFDDPEGNVIELVEPVAAPAR